MTATLKVGEITLANDAPMVLVGGLNVLEDEALALEVAQAFADVCGKLGMPYIFVVRQGPPR